MKLKKKLCNSLVVDLITILLIVLSFVGLFFPAVAYKVDMKKYSMKGYTLLFGKSIGLKYDGTYATKVSPNVFLWIMIALAVLAIVGILVFRKSKPKLAAEIQAIFGLYGLIAPIMMASKMTNFIFDESGWVAGVTGQYGMYLLAIPSAIVLILSLFKLTESKVLCALDFMVLPGMIYFLINNYIPMVGLYISFKKIDYSLGLWRSPWVGFSNFKTLFTNDSVWTITRNTLLYNIAFIVLGIITGIIVGICLAEVAKKFLQRTYQTLILLPQLISFVIVAYIIYAFLAPESGMLARLVYGADASGGDFYADPTWWPVILIFVNLWKMLGYNSIVFLSSIVGIDRSLYEAAKVDGASKWKQIWYVTIPQLKPTIITLFLLQTGRIFYSDFGLFYQVPLNQGALYEVTDTIDTFVYRALMVNNNISLASATSTYQAIVGFVLVLAVNLIVRKADKDSALF